MRDKNVLIKTNMSPLHCENYKYYRVAVSHLKLAFFAGFYLGYGQ